MTRNELINKALKVRYAEVGPLEIPADAPVPGNDCLRGLQAICRGETAPRHSPLMEPEHFLTTLRGHDRDRVKFFESVAERYACPTDFTSPGESEVREYFLMRLMVNDRVQIERDQRQHPHDDVLLKLNLTALYAPETTDLRFLDALNYYYEILARDSRNNFLVWSFLSLYTRALDAWIAKTK